MLPKMPEEVFAIWIAPLIKTDGWPFSHVRSIATANWVNNLSGYPLQFISNLNWHLQELPGSLVGFKPIVPKRIHALAKQYTTGIQQFDRLVINGPQRFKRALQYVVAHGNIPRPVVIVKDVFGMQLLDGHHRLAAMYAARKLPHTSFAAWVGK